MTDRYTQGQISRTISTLIIGGIMASQGMASEGEFKSMHSLGLYRGYQTDASPTFDQYANVITGGYHGSPAHIDFEQLISSLYSKLFSGQESLGDAFEKVLHENLWELYES